MALKLKMIENNLAKQCVGIVTQKEILRCCKYLMTQIQTEQENIFFKPCSYIHTNVVEEVLPGMNTIRETMLNEGGHGNLICIRASPKPLAVYISCGMLYLFYNIAFIEFG